MICDVSMFNNPLSVLIKKLGMIILLIVQFLRLAIVPFRDNREEKSENNELFLATMFLKIHESTVIFVDKVDINEDSIVMFSKEHF